MNRRQKEVELLHLRNERDVLKALEAHYANALADVKQKLLMLQANPLSQSKIYQIAYQQQLESQLSMIVDKLRNENFSTVQEYLKSCYADGFIGTMYDLQGQGVPLTLPLNQDQVLKAVQKTGDDFKLAAKLGVPTNQLKYRIQAELSRGLAAGLTYADIARNISNHGLSDMKRSMNIARTEGHRVQQESKFDSLHAAKAKGADIVKQWDSTLDGETRHSHQRLDGQVRELDDPFEVDGKTAQYPGGFGDPSEDCNCRCTVLQRARWAVEGETSYSKWNNENGGIIECSGYADFREKYLNKSGGLNLPGDGDTIQTQGYTDFKEYKDYFQKTYGVAVDDAVTSLNFEAVKKSSDGIEYVLSEFPQSRQYFTGLGVTDKKRAVMCAGFDGKISFSPNYYGGVNPRAQSSMVAGATNGFHPKNTGIFEVGSHEMGHLLELAMIHKNTAGGTRYDMIVQWNKSAQAKAIISGCCKDLKRVPDYKGMVNAEFISQVSGYAQTNASECLAECVADYVANGKDASPLAQAVWKALKEQLG